MNAKAIAGTENERDRMSRSIREMTEPELKQYFNLLMDATKAIMPADVKGFAVLVVDVDNVVQYASSLDRDGMIDAMRELASRMVLGDTAD